MSTAGDIAQGAAAQGPNGLGQRLALLARLAGPTMLARAGVMSMALVDIVMVGRHSTEELAFAALGLSLFVPLLVAGIGLMLGVPILTAQHFGAGRLQECGVVWRRGLPWALAVGGIAAVICALSEVWLTLLGHEARLAAGGGAVAQAVALGIPAQLLYIVCAFHLEATRRPLPGMIAMIVANLLNVALNWVLIYGNLGAPELGAVGSAIGSTIVRVFLFVALAVYILSQRDRAVYGVRLTPQPGRGPTPFWGQGGWRGAAPMRRLAYAAGASYAIESLAFMMVLQFAGWLGDRTLAAYSIAHNMESILFMAALGLGSATAVLVGNAVGADDRPGAAAAGRLGVGAVLGIMSAAAVIVWFVAPALAALYTEDEGLRALAIPVMVIAGVAAIADGAQLVASQASRAMGDVWATTARHVIAYWLVMAPLAYVLGVWAGFGGQGLMSAVVIGSMVSFLLHWRRFNALCAQKAD